MTSPIYAEVVSILDKEVEWTQKIVEKEEQLTRCKQDIEYLGSKNEEVREEDITMMCHRTVKRLG